VPNVKTEVVERAATFKRNREELCLFDPLNTLNCLFCSDFFFFRGRGALYKYQVRLDKIRSVERPKSVNRSLEKGGRGWRVGEARKQSRLFKREILLYFSTLQYLLSPK